MSKGSIGKSGLVVPPDPKKDERRHKNHCEYYRPDNVGRCCKDGIVMTCNGAAHCKYYVAKKKTS